MSVMITGNRYIGDGEPCFIIAEAGSNHNGDFETAKKLIDVAAEAGADAVKFQIFKADSLYSKRTPGFEYLKGQNTYDLIKSLETPRDWIEALAEYCNKKGVIFLASPFDHEAVDILDKYCPAFKVASFEIVDLDLVEYIARKGKPIIISTGMSSLGDIEDAIETANKVGNDDIVLLHCSSVYPTPVDTVNLRAMETISATFKKPVGFSDHTLGIHIPLAAVAMGAHVIEKHYTLSKKMKGPDHSFALEPEELKAMVSSIREAEAAMGSGIKKRSSAESAEMFTKARRSIHAKVHIPKGAKITWEMLVIKRPGYGIKPGLMDVIVGREARRDISEDEWITWEMV